ncbi:endonuclease/exonuclease/phosphatase family protein [Pseudomonas sp. zfem005]|uniref:endonuclease/exonuclease/phosphatase family protein n=1 Tax=Pseudomonas sp. zfem005 TaxID=3078200 RepID=UPI0029295BB6|nr:endonuclease/exonuclease/phosphatase family protein [Pseudomonas sp. zfem005]MDU9416616.1 endonuclease/exonuclease/phosphatase family protein [Pseudomonas sp. zfem005]
MLKALRFHLNQLAWLALVTLVLGQFGRLHWGLELLSHFMPIQALVMLVGAAVQPRNASSLLFALCGLGALAWSLTPLPTEPLATDAPTRRFLAFNLKLDNGDAAADARWLAEQKADLIFVSEATPAWSEQLAALRPFEACARYSDSPFGLALFSRLPLKRCQVLELTGPAAGYPYLRAELEDGTVVFGLHPPPPLGADLALARDESLRQLAERIAAEGPEVVVLGDLNVTAYSPRLRDFLDNAGLRLTSPRIRPTWWPGMLGLDHILVRGERPVRAVGALPWRGSDHRAVWLDQ